MNMQINQLVKTLLQKENLEQCSLHELEAFANRHPYFGAAQLLLTKKMQTEKPDQYEEQLQKTFLFFNNPLWVEQLLNNTGDASVTAPITPEEKVTEVINIDPPIVITKEPEVETVLRNESVASLSVPEHEPVPETTIEARDPSPVEEPMVTESVIVTTPTASFEEEEEPVHHLPVPEDEPAMVLPGLKIEAIDPETAPLVFEPYHTVDYFASQGINIKEEDKPKDKFGRQLKSFTDWLKVMKKLPVTAMAAEVSARSEEKVERMAEHSIEEREVVTETMAEVWEKQGNAARAIEVYHKLSLLYPSKSTYFAAKIDALKK